MKVINDKTEFDAAIQKPGLTVVDFYADWCGPCKQIAPLYEQLAAKYQDVAFIKVDVDAAQEVAQAEGVSAMPTFKFYVAGEVKETMQGADPAALEANVVKFRVAGGGGVGGSSFGGKSNSLGGTVSTADDNGQPRVLDPRQARLAKFGAASKGTGDGMQMKDSPKTVEKTAESTQSKSSAKAVAGADDEDAEIARAIALSLNAPSADAEEKDKKQKLGDPEVEGEDMNDPHRLVPLPVDDALLAELLGMGFTDVRSRKGLHYGATVEGAINWLSDHENDPNLDDEFLVRLSDVNRVPLTPEEIEIRAKQLKELAKVKRAERLEREKKEEVVKEKERRERGQNIEQIDEQRKTMAKKRELDKIKKEKDDQKNEKARILAELARDKALRAKNNGVLPSVLGLDGYNPSAIQYDKDGHVAPLPDPDGAPPKAAPRNPGDPPPPILNPIETIDNSITTLMKYKTRGDGGSAMKLLALFIKNVSENPTDEKYRSINTQSNAFKTKLQPFVGPMNILRSLGFEKDEEGKMRLSADPDVALFASTLTKLQTAMETFAKMNNSF